jgi:hypothetical protein
MRRPGALLVLCLITAPCLGGQATAKPKQPDPIFGVDKVKHFFIAGFIESMTFAGLEAAGASRSSARTGGIAAMTVASFGREIHDHKVKGLFSVRDLLWDGIGATAALIVINKTQR